MVLAIANKVDMNAGTLRNAAALSRRAVIKAGFCTVAALPLAGCWGDGSVTRYVKIIATAEVDGKQVQGSTVMELKWKPASGRMYQYEKGEALILELAGKGTVYILSYRLAHDGDITGGLIGMLVNQAAGIRWPQNAQKQELGLVQKITGRFKMEPWRDIRAFPLFVAFKDEKRKDSIYEVKPEDFAKNFGAGVKFVGLEFEFTDESITDALKKRLPMLVERNLDNVFPRDPDGQTTAYRTRPFPKKMSENMFFAFGDY
jgi:hypothetical protein